MKTRDPQPLIAARTQGLLVYLQDNQPPELKESAHHVLPVKRSQTEGTNFLIITVSSNNVDAHDP